MQGWGPVRRPIIRYFPLVGPIGRHGENLRSRRFDQVLPEQGFVVLQFFLGLWVVGSIDNGFAVPGEKRPAVVSLLGGESLSAGTVGIHRIDVEISRSHGSENDLFSVGRNGSLGVVTRIFRQCCQSGTGTVGTSTEDFIRGINGPNIPLASVRRRRAGIARRMSGGINESLPIRKEKPTSRAAFPAV